jgi:type III restriction enzyme
VAETADMVFMLEPKASTQMEDSIVLTKREAAVQWCANATLHAQTYCGKPWRYVLIPHNEITVNVTLEFLANRFGT